MNSAKFSREKDSRMEEKNSKILKQVNTSTAANSNTGSNNITRIDDPLIRSVSSNIEFDRVIALNFHIRSNLYAKIAKIEGLQGLVNLEELNLSYNIISKIENVGHLVKLKELNLAENNIKKIENLERLVNLNKLNLNGNLISELPEEIGNLKELKVFKISRNKISSLDTLFNLALLPQLASFNMAENPICKHITHQDFVALINPALTVSPKFKCIDSKSINYERRIHIMRNSSEFVGGLGKIGSKPNFRSTEFIDEKENSGMRLSVKDILLLQQDNESKQHQIKIISKEYTEAIEKIAELEQTLAELQSNYQFQKFNNKKEEGLSAVYQGSLTRTLEILNRNQEKMLDSEEDFKSEKKILEEKRSGLLKKCNQIEEQLMEIKKNIRACKTEYLRRKDASGTNQQFDMESEELNEKMLFATDKYKETEELREQFAEIQRKLDTTRTKIEKTESLLRNLTERGESASENEPDSSDSALLEKKLKHLKDKLSGYQALNNETKSRLAENYQQIEDVTKEIESFKQSKSKQSKEKDLKEMQNYIKLLEDQSVNSENQILCLQEEIQSIERRQSILSEVIFATEKDIQIIENEKSFLINLIKNTESQINYPGSYSDKSDISQGKTDKASFEALSKLQLHCFQILSALKGIVHRASEQMFYEDEVESFNMNSNRYLIKSLLSEIEAIQEAIERASSKMPEPKKVETFSEKIRDVVSKFCQLLENFDDLGQAFAKEECARKKEEANGLDKLLREKLVELGDLQEKAKRAYSMEKNVLRALQSLQQKIHGSKERIKYLEIEEFDIVELPESSDDVFRASDEIEVYIQKFTKLVERNLRKMSEFNRIRAQFTEEFEQETRELGLKWEEIERKKEDVKAQMDEDKDNMYRIIDEEHEKIKTEKEILSKERTELERQRKEVDFQVRKMQSEENNRKSQMKLELEKYESIKKSYELELGSYKQGLEEVEKIKLRLDEEYKEQHGKINQEKKLYKDLTLENEKLKKMREELELEEVRVLENITEIKNEEEALSKQLNETRTQAQRADYELRSLVDRFNLEESHLKQTSEKLEKEITEKKTRLTFIEETLRSKSTEMRELELNMENYDAILGEYKAAKENYKKQATENTRIKKEIEERRYYLEELSLKASSDEETLLNLKKRTESLTSIFNERQQQLLEAEEQLARNMQEISEHEQKLNKMMNRYSSLLEDLKRTENESDSKSKELTNLNKKLANINSEIQEREDNLVKMDSEVEQKIREMNEFHQALQENEENYSNILLKNRENLESMKEEIEAKEIEIRKLSETIEAKSKEKEIFEEKSSNYIKELRLISDKTQDLETKKRQKEAELNKLLKRFDDILREEQTKSESLRALINQESELESRCDELEKYIQELQIERDEIMSELKPSALKFNSQLISKTLLDSGEKLTEKSQKKIKDLTESYYEAKDLRIQNEKLKNENHFLIRKLKDTKKLPPSHHIPEHENKNSRNYDNNPGPHHSFGSNSEDIRQNFEGDLNEEEGSLFISPRSAEEKNELSDWEVMHHGSQTRKEKLQEDGPVRYPSGGSFEQVDNDENSIEKSKREFYENMEQVENQLSFLQRKSIS